MKYLIFCLLFTVNYCYSSTKYEWIVYPHNYPVITPVSCAAFNVKDPNIHLTVDTIYIRSNNGVSKVRIRFGNPLFDKVSRNALPIEIENSLVMLMGSEFDKARSSPNIHVELMTRYGKIEAYDLDTSSIHPVIELMNKKCR